MCFRHQKISLPYFWKIIYPQFGSQATHLSVRKRQDCSSSRIQRWALTLGMYEYELIHKSGATHGNADALSRLPLPGSASEETPQPAETVLLFEELQKGPVTAEQIKLWTRRDPVLSRVQQFVLKGWPTGAIEKDLKPYWHKRLKLSFQQQVKRVYRRS